MSLLVTKIFITVEKTRLTRTTAENGNLSKVILLYYFAQEVITVMKNIATIQLAIFGELKKYVYSHYHSLPVL